jgi:hypothetical protein
MASKSPNKADPGKAAPNRWSQRVTRESNALDLDPGVFTMAPKEMAESLRRSAEASRRRKTTPFRSAMSMLVFYQNRAGRTLSAKARKDIELAKDELRRLYGKPPKGGK